MPKKIFIFLIVFIGLSVLSAVILRFAKQDVANLNPLVSVDVDKINNVSFRDPNFSVSAQKEGGVWHLTAPVKDVADQQIFERTVASLKGFTVGSSVSEKKERYIEFNLNDDRALSVQVSAEGDSSPRLDIFLGKDGPGYGSTFLRFKGKAPIYLAENLPSYIIMRSSSAYRSHKLLQATVETATRLYFKTDKNEYDLIRSSNIWTLGTASAPVSGKVMSWVTSLQPQLDALRVIQFYSKDNLLAPSGLERPLIQIKMTSPRGVEHVIIGQKIVTKKSDPNYQDQHYATIDGRDDVVTIPTLNVKTLSDFLKNLSQ